MCVYFEDMSVVNIQNIELQPLTGHEFITVLQEFCALIKSCIGPNGHLKLLVTGGNYSQLTSISVHLMERMPINNPVCQYIATAIKSLPDFGLYAGVVISLVLCSALREQESNCLSYRPIVDSIEELIVTCMELMDSENASYAVDFTSVNIFIMLSKSIVRTKLFGILTEDNITDLCVHIVKAFILSLDIETLKIGKILIITESGQENFKTYNGILYRITDFDKNTLEKIKKLEALTSNINILIFTCMLSEETSNEESVPFVVDNFLVILKQCEKLGVHIIACQKVVDNSIKLYLQREGIVLLDRMGITLTEALVELTGALPISDISSSIMTDLHTMLGTVKSVGCISYNYKHYVSLENDNKSVVTLFVHCFNIIERMEIKTVIQQVVDSLKTIVQTPRVTCGGGCLEVWMSVHLQLTMQNKKQHQNRIQQRCLDWFQKALIAATGIKLPLAFDTVYCHAWPVEDADQLTCNCKLVTRDLVEQSGGTWVLLHENRNITVSQIQHEYSLCKKPQLNMRNDLIIESLIHKKNAIIMALETCINVLSIGVIIYKK